VRKKNVLAKEASEGIVSPLLCFPPLADLAIIFIGGYGMIWDM